MESPLRLMWPRHTVGCRAMASVVSTDAVAPLTLKMRPGSTRPSPAAIFGPADCLFKILQIDL